MAIALRNTGQGSVENVEGAHYYMQSLRSMLLEVGLEQLQILGSYDASEAGTADQIPIATTSQQHSAYMHFAFTDSRQSESPLVISIAMGSGPFFTTKITGGVLDYPRYFPRVRVSQGVDSEGDPLGATLATNNTGPTNSSSNATNAVYDLSGQGSYVSYSGEALTIVLGLAAVSLAGLVRSCIHIHLERLPGNDFAALPLHQGHAAGAQLVYYSSGTSINSNASLQSRIGGSAGFFESGSAVVSPIYVPNYEGSMTALSNVFTVHQTIGSRGDLLTMDFKGTPRKYLLDIGSLSTPYLANSAWIYEFE